MKICPLCENSVNKFQTNSHIIPEWMCKDSRIYENNRSIAFQRIENEFHRKIIQNGYKGSFICIDCEKETSKLDSYASLFFKNEYFHKKENLKYVSSINNFKERTYYYDYQGFEFKKIQKFILSIYLRCHFYALSQQENQLIIKAHLKNLLVIYHNDENDYESYPIFIFYVPPKNNKLQGSGIISLPHVTKVCGHFTIQFLACNFNFILDVSSHIGLVDEGIILRPPGNIFIICGHLEDTGTFKTLKDIYAGKQVIKS